MKKFTSVHDVTNLDALIQSAIQCKKNPFESQLGHQKTLGMIFMNPSLRTRMSTQKAAQNLGMQVISLDTQSGWQLEFQFGVVMNSDKAEHIKEAVKVMSAYCDVLALRSFPGLTDREKDYNDFILNQFIQYAEVPVISLESAIRHPLQSLADLVTIEELKTKASPKIVLSWAPHPRALPQAVANSFSEWVLAKGYDLTICHPEGLALSSDFTQGATITNNQNEALENADFVYVKNWSSFADYGTPTKGHEDWMITLEKLKATNQAKLMHCLPMRRNVVIADDAMESSHNAIYQLGANREWAAQAVLQEILKSVE